MVGVRVVTGCASAHRSYADSSFTTIAHLSSRNGFNMRLWDSLKGHVIQYAVENMGTGFTCELAGAVYSFANAFDYVFAIQSGVHLVTNLNVPIQMFTDSKFLFGVIARCKATAPKSLMIHIHSVRIAIHANEICHVSLER